MMPTIPMPAIGHVTKSQDGNFKGVLRALAFSAPITILLNPSKSADTQPDCRVYSNTVEIGGGWIKKGKTSGEDYVSLSLADPAFGPRSSTPIWTVPPARTTRMSSRSSGTRSTKRIARPAPAGAGFLLAVAKGRHNSFAETDYRSRVLEVLRAP
jgi:uncharacterized protein (DUF736 family)